MELIRGLHNIRPEHRGCVLTIGNFDGVHLGHQAVLEQVHAQAEARHVPSVAMIFEPQPLELFAPGRAPARLYRWQDKYRHIAECGIDRLLLTQFNKRFANLSAEDFIEQVLVTQLGVSLLVVGDDFRFGKGRTGDFALLKKAADHFGFAVIDTQSYRTESIRVSSTAIRSALTTADFESAASMLGRPYAIYGRVRHGEKRGRTIGFPTANIGLHRLHPPLRGVYAVGLETENHVYAGVANIGRKPTVNGTEELLEVHLFEFPGPNDSAELYGQNVVVTPLAWLREERRFESFAALQAQITEDATLARALLLPDSVTEPDAQAAATPAVNQD
ncbi:bifunctional riboflavin kinase/FAD synthetase [Aliidiomarina halalkaliphila]|uniref:Riboflavin biosynthesis protein n=1 Tax=Aliidiomarina halalkaliphila TaxID=2593535 RepID=A0A552X5M7_9GAMM|nr:bifunctional riboflavin kinase/FAD synthetase [Aliidiomarina halalkaliphila]TRW50286.1 bifunctional riboflavin kinase/FAD synthetase [Aliidiomarina halalkaliphila]